MRSVLRYGITVGSSLSNRVQSLRSDKRNALADATAHRIGCLLHHLSHGALSTGCLDRLRDRAKYRSELVECGRAARSENSERAGTSFEEVVDSLSFWKLEHPHP